MKRAIGDAPLAIASGVTPENVPDYLPWADCFLVATGISYTFDELDPDRVRDLVQVVRSWPH
jgi:predicted TIM-barrel enzyme